MKLSHYLTPVVETHGHCVFEGKWKMGNRPLRGEECEIPTTANSADVAGFGRRSGPRRGPRKTKNQRQKANQRRRKGQLEVHQNDAEGRSRQH